MEIERRYAVFQGTNIQCRSRRNPPSGVHYMCSSLDDALDLVFKEPLASKIERVFVIGGAAVYKDAMDHKSCRKLYTTEIDYEYGCDVFYPEFDRNIYKPIRDEKVSSEVREEDGVSYKFCVYERI
ncbi:dihydrofolate reductase isoform X2 [Exaiptasia diaphana]|uniref:dihydrofolate reductase n=1 Tax=Exaiptasia diaphana TaxID=2652724 RepID=A0A913Y0U3_EXADI|nr:dihydrofolate reductase isoform X2 [Exaiptasia diaphana]